MGPYGRNKCKNDPFSSTFLESDNPPMALTRDPYITPPGTPDSTEDDYITPRPQESPGQVCVTPPPPYDESESQTLDLFGLGDDSLLDCFPPHSTIQSDFAEIEKMLDLPETQNEEIDNVLNLPDTQETNESEMMLNITEAPIIVVGNSHSRENTTKRKMDPKDKRPAKKSRGTSYFGSLMKNVYSISDLIEPLVLRKESRPQTSRHHQKSSPSLVSSDPQPSGSSLAGSERQETGLASEHQEQRTGLAGDHQEQETFLAGEHQETVMAIEISSSSVPIDPDQPLSITSDVIQSIPDPSTKQNPVKSRKPRKKCSDESCISCNIERNCQSCDSCLNPGLKMKCVLRCGHYSY